MSWSTPILLLWFLGIASMCGGNRTTGVEQLSQVSSESVSVSSENVSPPDAPRNLRGDVQFHQSASKNLYMQVTVYWSPPEAIWPVSYDLQMRVAKNQSKNCSNSFTSYHVASINSSQTMWTIPHQEHGNDKKIINFNCSYIVKIQPMGSSLNKIGKSSEKVIHVPLCLENKNCECREKLPELQDLDIIAEKGTDALISWKYPYKTNDIQHFEVIVATPLKGLMYEKYKSQNINYTTEENYNLTISVPGNEIYRVMIIARDEIGCPRATSHHLLECTSTWTKCLCFNKTLPAPNNLNVTIQHNESNSYALITWSYPVWAASEIKSFSFQINEENPLLEPKQIELIELKQNSTPIAEVKEQYYVATYPCDDSPKVRKIYIRAFNDDQCYSSSTKDSEVFTCPQGNLIVNEEAGTSHVPIYIAVGIIVLTAALITSVFLCRQRVSEMVKKMRPDRRDSYLGSIGSETSGGTHLTYLPIYQEEKNVLYVPLEIQKARACGRADQYEISQCLLELGKVIGEGAFGRVFIATGEAIAGNPKKMTVAVKQIRDDPCQEEREAFLAEINMMKEVGEHPNIVAMIGCCTLQEPFCMVLEFVPCGDLLRYLRRLRDQYLHYQRSMQSHNHSLSNGHAGSTTMTSLANSEQMVSYQTCSLASDSLPDKDYIMAGDIKKNKEDSCTVTLLSSTDAAYPFAPTKFIGCSYKTPHVKMVDCSLDAEELIAFASQIANGMCHLSEKGITHRDLAARNILIDENKTLKISDFGLSRTGIYITRGSQKLPWRWLSIEAITHNLYTLHSDVWAFGVVLWEICTLGGHPYSSISDFALRQYLLDGNRLEKPPNCDEEFYDVMDQCWREEPLSRPTFHELYEMLQKMKNSSHIYVNFNTDGNLPLPPSEQQDDKQDWTF